MLKDQELACPVNALYLILLQLDNYAIKPGKNIKVNISVANQRLFVGNIPKSKSKDEIMEEFSKKTGISKSQFQISFEIFVLESR